jgi:serine/threonine-protein kinase
MAYAHSRGVLHRDLKPGNIMLGKYGETLVVDWGLAKAQDQSELESLTERPELPLKLASGSALERTSAGASVGTPAYMSPEQAEGRTDLVGPRSDVYCLGATLYHLLTGHAPCEAEQVADVLHKVVSGDIPRPRSINPRLALALEAICLKAMAAKPGDRYESVQALKSDLERWLADEPVTAFREPWPDRLGRWGRKHQTLVTSAAAALFMAACAAGLVAAQRSAHARDLARANRALDTQRTKAEEREQLAIDAVKRFRDAVTGEPELKNNPALEGLRKRLLKEPLAFFRSLRERLQADRDTRTESLARLAEASSALGFLTGEIGDQQDALIAYAECLAIREKLADADPSVSEFQRDLASSHGNIGNLLSTTGKPADALKSYQAALAIQTKLAHANPSVSAFQSDLAGSHNNIGNLLSVTGKPADALKSYEAARELWTKLADADPSASAFQSDLAGSHYNIGKLLSATGKPGDALKSHEAALLIRTKLADANPSVSELQSDLASSQNDIGLLLHETAKPADAMKSYQAALLIRTKLADANPSVSVFQSDLANSHNNIGLLMSETGKPADALKSYQAALAIQRKQVREHPESPDFASGLGGTHHNLAVIDMNAKRFAEARDGLRQAVECQQRALASNPAHPTYRQRMAKHFDHLIESTRALGDFKGLAEAERQFAEFRETDPAMAAFDARLRAIVKGEQRPNDVGERLQLAERAYEIARYAAAARLLQEALELDPRLGDDRQAQHRYNAACAAAQAGSGRGKDDPAPSEPQKTKLRQQALDWLTAELGDWAKLLATADNEQRGGIKQTLEHWQQDNDLASIRDEAELAKLSETERLAFRKLWADVDALLKKASGP